jgi:hypothetical protein
MELADRQPHNGLHAKKHEQSGKAFTYME